MNEFIPRSDPQLCLWLDNYSKRIGMYGAKFGLSPDEITAQQKWCAELTEAIKTDDQKHKEWRAAVKVTREAKKSSLAAVRAMIERIKHLPGWTPTIGQAMGVVKKAPPPTEVDTIKPKLQVVTEAGQVKLKFTRRPLDGINVYMRRKGQKQWQLLARATRSPFIDPTALLFPNTSEIREYRAMGVRKDKEVGQPSEIVVVVVGT